MGNNSFQPFELNFIPDNFFLYLFMPLKSKNFIFTIFKSYFVVRHDKRLLKKDGTYKQ